MNKKYKRDKYKGFIKKKKKKKIEEGYKKDIIYKERI
jgi:hypothetical protein